MTEEQENEAFAALILGVPAQRNDDAFIVELAETLHKVMHEAAARGDAAAHRCAGKTPSETLLNVTEYFDIAGDDVGGSFL